MSAATCLYGENARVRVPEAQLVRGLRWSRRAGLVTLRVRGYLNRRLGERIAGLGRRLLAGGARHLLVDLEGTYLVNHQGVAELLELAELVRKVEGRLAFRHATPTVEKVFRIMGLTPV